MGNVASNPKGMIMPNNELSIKCTQCRAQIPVVATDVLVAAGPGATIEINCLKCSKMTAAVAQAWACPNCHETFRAGDLLGARSLVCPLCRADVTLPDEKRRTVLQTQASSYRWIVRGGAPDSPAARFSGLDELTTAMTTGRVLQNDACQVHDMAPAEKLRDVADRYPKLRALYDPAGAARKTAGDVAGGILVIAYLIADIVAGAILFGDEFWLILLFGTLMVLFAPTIIGAIVIYFIAAGMGIPAIAAGLGVLGIMVAAALVFLVGKGLGTVLASLWATATGLHAKRRLNWELSRHAAPTS